MVMGESREAPMCLLVVDADEGVRSEAVKAVLDLCQHNSDAVPPAFLQVSDPVWARSEARD